MCNVNYFEYVMHIMYVYNMWDCFVLWAQGLEKNKIKYYYYYSVADGVTTLNQLCFIVSCFLVIMTNNTPWLWCFSWIHHSTVPLPRSKFCSWVMCGGPFAVNLPGCCDYWVIFAEKELILNNWSGFCSIRSETDSLSPGSCGSGNQIRILLDLGCKAFAGVPQ